MPVTKEQIKFSLGEMGIKKGDILLVHSALSSIGYVEGGADTVIDALLETVGEEGTIAMSTLTGWFKPYDSKTSPSEVGKISEVFRKRPGIFRSLHPVHSIAAYGRQAQYITEGHDKADTGCGRGTPYDKIKQLNGKVMLLGVDMDRNTIMHFIEEEADLPFLLELSIPAPTYIEDYKNKQFILKKFPPGHRDFLNLTPILREKDALVEGKIGNALVKVMNVKELFEIGIQTLKQQPGSFICSNPNCIFCRWATCKLDGEKDFDHDCYKGRGCLDDKCEICVVE